MRTGPLRKDTLEEMLLLALIVSEEMYSSLGYIDYDDCRGKSCVGHDMCMGHDPNATICGMGHDPNGKLRYVRALLNLLRISTPNCAVYTLQYYYMGV